MDLSAVLISHIHLDHLHTRSLGGIDRATPVIVPRGAGSLLHRRGFADVIELGAGEQIEVDGVAVAAVPAHHDGQRHPLGGTRAETIGFVIGTTRRVYFAGDTELFDGMAELARRITPAAPQRMRKVCPLLSGHSFAITLLRGLSMNFWHRNRNQYRNR